MAGRIIGRRMIGRKRKWRFLAPGGRYRTNYYVDVEHHDLHSTKGWKFAKRFTVGLKQEEWDAAPAVQEYFVPARGWPAPKGPSVTLSPDAMERARKRNIHPRYKR